MREAERVARLQAMGITVWRRRRASRPADGHAPASAAPAPAVPRVRLEAGTGPWLLIADERARARYEALLADLRAVLGPARCRFGAWADSPEAGVAVDEWPAHGIEHAIAFGADDALPPGFVAAPSLGELAGSASARRGLWSRLRPRLEA